MNEKFENVRKKMSGNAVRSVLVACLHMHPGQPLFCLFLKGGRSAINQSNIKSENRMLMLR